MLGPLSPAQTISDVGGIDFNPAGLNIQEQGTDIKINVPAIDIKIFENMNINGFTPVIIQIVPITNLPLILGIQTKEPEPFEVTSASR